MSSLKDLASLIMVPSLYKDGRLDTVKPLGNGILHPDSTGNNDGTDGSTPAEGNFTFSRGSNLAATRVDVNGLIEKGRENLLPYSNTFDQWSPTAGTFTQGVIDPFGGNTAWSWTASNTDPYIYNQTSGSGVYTLSIWAKGVGSTIGKDFEFRLGGAVQSFTLTSDWQRFELYVNGSFANIGFEVGNPAVAGDVVHIYGAQLELGLVATDYIETGTSAAQSGILEDMPRLDYSGGASCPSLLLEPQRSNLLPNSEYFGAWNNTSYPVTITSNAATSPDGNTNATLITPTSGNDRHAIREINVVAIAGTTYTLSAFFKKAGSRYVVFGDSGDNLWRLVTADLDEGTITNETNATGTIEPYANDWYRITCTFTRNNPPTIQTFLGASPNDTNIAAPSFDNTSLTTYVYGAQVEASSSYPTSYIPTYGSSVTRSVEFTTLDNMQSKGITDSGAYSCFFDLSQEPDGAFSGDNSQILNFNGTSGTIISVRKYYGVQEGRLRFYSNLDVQNIAYLNTDNKKWCMVVNDKEVKIYSNGFLKYTSNLTNSQNGLNYISVTSGSAERTSTNYSSLLVFPTALTDAEATALTE